VRLGDTLRPVPLSLIPLALYGIGALFGWDSASAETVVETVWDRTLLDLTLASGATFALRVADVLIAIAGLTLLASLLRAAFGASSVAAGLLSMIVLCGYVIAFLLVDVAATSTFFALLVLAFVDTIATIALAMRRGRSKPAEVTAPQSEPSPAA